MFTYLLCLPLILGAPSSTRPAQDNLQSFAEAAAAAIGEFGYVVNLDNIETVLGSQSDPKPSAWGTNGMKSLAVQHLYAGFGDWTFTEKASGASGDDSGYPAAYYSSGKIVVFAKHGDSPREQLCGTGLLAHELVHAWRDREGSRSVDFRGANVSLEQSYLNLFLSEGEARLVQLAVQSADEDGGLRELAERDTGIDENLGHRARSELVNMFYSHGARFAGSRWEAGGWDAVRRTRDQRPPSTEQILHPAKDGRDLPEFVTLPAWPSELPKAELVSTDCLGEFGTYQLMRTLEDNVYDSRVAAAGWDGDRVQLYQLDSGGTAVIWRTAWDRELDAQQFYSNLRNAGDGEWRLHGRVVDWVRTTEGALASELLDHLAAAPSEISAVSDGAESTSALEADWQAQQALAPRLRQGRLEIPELDIVASAPSGWQWKVYAGRWYMESVQQAGDRMNMLHLWTGAQPALGNMNFETALAGLLELEASDDRSIEEDGCRTIAGRNAAYFKSRGIDESVGWHASFVEAGQQLEINLRYAGRATSSIEAAGDEFFAGLRSGSKMHGGAENVPLQSELNSSLGAGSEAGSSRTRIVVKSALDGEPLANADIWIVPFETEFPPSLQASAVAVRKFCRHYRTDENGSLEVSFRQPQQYVQASYPGQANSKWMDLKQGEQQILEMEISCTIEVTVLRGGGWRVCRCPRCSRDRE